MRGARARDLAPAHFRAATEIAERLAGVGHPAWIVGGAARDLARGVTPKDVDMVTSATPDEVEALFPRTVGVGRAFGIVVVLLDEAQVEVATLRTESGYGDGRRPDQVAFGTSVEEDAARRDFTCNALYLDPLTDAWLDPTGGLQDLEAGLLRTVGEPARRFGEDGLRLLRMARFQATLDAVLAPGLPEAAAGSLAALRGVSPERVHQELARILTSPRSGTALETLFEVGVLQAALPDWAERDRCGRAARLAALAELPQPPGEALGFAWLLEADPSGPSDPEGDLQVLDGLRPSRALRGQVERAWAVRRALAEAPEGASRARLLRDPGWEVGCDLALAWARSSGAPDAHLVAQRDWRAAAGEEELFPPALLTPADLLGAGVPRGPRLGELLRALEDAQLEGAVVDRAGAEAWLSSRLEAGE